MSAASQKDSPSKQVDETKESKNDEEKEVE